MDNTAQENMIYALAGSPAFARDGICFAGQTAGLARSCDGGLSWADAYATLGVEGQVPTTALAVSPRFEMDRHVFAAAQGAVLRSEDGGVTWAVATLPEPVPVVSALALASNYQDGGTIWAATLEDGVLRSPDGAATWETWNFGLIDPRVLCLAVAPGYRAEGWLYAGTETSIYVSENSGRSWRELGFPAEHAPVLCIATAPGALFAGTEADGVFRSWDGGLTWDRAGDGAASGAVNAILVDEGFAGTRRVLALVDGALLLSENGGGEWREMANAVDEEITAVAAPVGLRKEAVVLVGTAGGRVVRTAVRR